MFHILAMWQLIKDDQDQTRFGCMLLVEEFSLVGLGFGLREVV